MRIVFVAPIVYLNGIENPPHMGLCSLQAVLEEHCHEVTILNLNQTLREPYETAEAKEGILSTDFYQQAIRDILLLEPDVVGFSTIGASYPTTLVLVKTLKDTRPDLKIILGGIQASLCAPVTLQHFPEVDYILAGEAEYSLPVFLHHLEAGLPFPPDSGIYYRTPTGEITFTGEAPLVQNLDTLPSIYSQIDISTLTEVSIDVGRGCPFKCYYCCTNNYWRRTYRLRSAKAIVDEIEHHYHTSGKRLFAFNHDLLTCNRVRFRELLQTLKERQLPVRWRCSSRIDTVDAELLQEMASCGCYAIFFGIETGSPRMQKVIQKNLDLSRVLPLLEECRRLKIDCTASFICGMPEETLEDLLQTAELVYECIARSISPQIHLLAPFQGTDLYRRYQDQLQFDGNYSNVGGFVINNPVEEALIQSYPDLFCNFYYIDNPHIPRTILRNIEQYPNLLWYFWRTTGVLRYTHGIAFKEIFLDFISKPRKNAEIPEFVQRWVNSIAEPSRILQEVFNLECTLFDSRYTSSGDEPPLPSQTLEPGAYFQKRPGSKLYPLCFDPAAVEEAIRQHRSAQELVLNQELMALISAPQQGLIPKFNTVPSNSSVINIYQDATGELRIQDVITEATEALQGVCSADEVQESVMSVVKQMVNMRLVLLVNKTI